MTRRKYISGIDVDTERMADALRRFADGLELNDVAVTAASTTNDVHDAEDLAQFGFSLRYHASHEYKHVVDMIQYATDGYLRFSDPHIAPILRGEKTTTVRYAFERSFDHGTDVAFVDEDDDKFAEATVEAYIDLPVRRVCDFGIGPYDTADAQELVDSLQELYNVDDDAIDRDTYVTVILFSGIEADDDYPTENYV